MILVAAGLKQERNALAGDGVRVVAGGGDGARLERELEDAAADAEALISMGLCGALAEGLKPGDWVVASSIVCPPRVFEIDPKWSEILIRALSARSGPMLGSDSIFADAETKRAAHAATGALAVDMESHIAAGVARRHGLPFAAARVVSDAADRSLPKAAQVGMAADGGMDVGAVIGALARDPRQLVALIRVGAEVGSAFRELRRGRDLLGPGMGRLDLGKLLLDVS